MTSEQLGSYDALIDLVRQEIATYEGQPGRVAELIVRARKVELNMLETARQLRATSEGVPRALAAGAEVLMPAAQALRTLKETGDTIAGLLGGLKSRRR